MKAATMADWALRMNESFDLTEEKSFKKLLQGFTRMGQFQVGVRRHERRNVDGRPLQIDMGPKGKVEIQERPQYGFGVTYAGTPHHVPGIIGYWHINDVDEIYFHTKNENGEEFHVILEPLQRPGDRDMFAWYCQQCNELLFCHTVESGNLGLGFPGLWRAEHDAVTAFNIDRALRVCGGCGVEHPLAYRFWAAHNSEQEEAARHIW